MSLAAMTFDETKDLTIPRLSLESINWEAFLRRPCTGPRADDLLALHAGKSVLITGGGGSIGSCLARFVLEANPREIILLDSSEHNLYESHSALIARRRDSQIVPVLMDLACDLLLDRLFAERQPDIVYHTAAFKHVPLLERNPVAATRSNILGAYALAEAARTRGIPHVVSISTDKAVSPRSVLGVTKRISELIFLALNGPMARMTSIRFGNVLGSRGSVVPLFLRQISEGGAVTVTDPLAERYFLTLNESIRLIVSAADGANSGGLLVPELGKPIAVVRLAEYLIRESGFVPGREIPIVFTGLRPGDKMTEELVSSNERKRETSGNTLFEIETPVLPEGEIHKLIDHIESLLTRGDIRGLLDLFRSTVPEYQPSREVLTLAGERSAAGTA